MLTFDTCFDLQKSPMKEEHAKCILDHVMKDEQHRSRVEQAWKQIVTVLRVTTYGLLHVPPPFHGGYCAYELTLERDYDEAGV